MTAPHSETPVSVGGFRLERLLSSGAQAEVYLAADPELARPVALKVFAQGFDEAGASRLAREARALSRVDHPGVCPVFRAGVDEGRPFLAMKHVPGPTLATHLEAARHGEPRSDAARLVARLARAVQAVHDVGLVHRDLKPANVIVTDGEQPVIVDFGVTLEREGVTLTRTGDLLGSPAYMAPEQFDAPHTVGPAADVFALGACLFECLTLRRPFDGPTRAHLYRAIAASEPSFPAPRSRRERDLFAVAFRALHKDPRRRYGTAAELAEDLEAAAEGRPVSARPVTRRELLWRWARVRPGFAAASVLIALLALATLAGGGFWLVEREHIDAGRALLRQRELWGRIEAGFLEYGESDPVRALTHFEPLLAEPDPSPLVVAGGVISYNALGKPEGALAILDRIAGERRTAPGIVRLRADTLRLARRPEDAKAALASARGTPDALDHLLLGLAAIARGHRGDHRAFPHAMRHLERAICLARSPQPLAYFEFVHATNHVGKFDRGREAARTAVRIWPRSPTAWYRVSVARWGATGADAIPMLSRARDLFPGSFTIVVALAEALRIHQRADDAVEVLEGAVRVSPKDGLLVERLAEFLESANRRDEALKRREEAVRLAPDEASAHLFRARLCELQGKRSEQLEALQAARKLAPGDPDVLKDLGQLLFTLDRFRESASCLRRAVRASPASPVLWYLLADAEFRSQRREAAARAARRSVELNPTNPMRHLKLGSFLEALGRRDEAVAVYRVGVRVAPRAELLCNLGLALTKLHQYGEGLEFLARGHRTGSARSVWPFASGPWLRRATERGERMRRTFEALRARKSLRSRRLVELVPFAEAEGHVVWAARAFELYLEDGPGADGDPPVGVTAVAARAAARAARGGGEDGASLDVRERVAMAGWALEWLSLDLEERSVGPTIGFPWLLASWQADPGYAAIRDSEHLAALPVDLRKRCHAFWRKVERTRRHSR